MDGYYMQFTRTLMQYLTSYYEYMLMTRHLMLNSIANTAIVQFTLDDNCSAPCALHEYDVTVCNFT